MELFSLGIITGFFASLVWWEYIFIIIMVGGFTVSSNTDNPLGVLVGFGFFFFFPWGESGSLFSHFGLTGIFMWFGIYLVLGIIWAAFKWNILSQKVILKSLKEYESDSYYRETYTKEEYIKKEVKNSANYGYFFNWITMWPISIILHFFSETLYNILIGFKNILYNLYASISNRNIKNTINKESKKHN